jgi:hypothetical protein
LCAARIFSPEPFECGLDMFRAPALAEQHPPLCCRTPISKDSQPIAASWFRAAIRVIEALIGSTSARTVGAEKIAAKV